MKNKIITTLIIVILLASLVSAASKDDVAKAFSSAGTKKQVEVSGNTFYKDSDGQWIDRTGRAWNTDGTPGNQKYIGVTYQDSKGRQRSNFDYQKVKSGSATKTETSYSYNAVTGEKTTYEHLGDEVIVTIGEGSLSTSIAFRVGTKAETNIDWSKVTADQINKKEYTTRDGKTMTFDHGLGEEGSSYTISDPQTKSVQKFRYTDDQGNSQLTYKEEYTKVGDSEIPVYYYYEDTPDLEKGGTIPANTVVIGTSSQPTYDLKVWESYTAGRTIQRLDSSDGSVYFSDNERLTKSGNTYTNQRKDDQGNWQLIGKTTQTQTSDGGTQRTSETYDNGELSGKDVLVTYPDGTEYRQSYDDENELQSLTIKPSQGETFTLSGSTAENYAGKRTLNRENAAEIALAYEKLGSDGKFKETHAGISTYTTDEKTFSTGPDFDLLMEFDDGKEIRSTTKYKTSTGSAFIGGEDIEVPVGGTKIEETDPDTGRKTTTILNKDNQVESYGDIDTLTDVHYDSDGQTYITEHKGTLFESTPADQKENVIVSASRIEGTKFYAINRNTGEYMVYNKDENRYMPVSEAFDSNGKIKSEYQGKIYEEKNGVVPISEVKPEDLKVSKTGKEVADQQKEAEKEVEKRKKEKQKKVQKQRSTTPSGIKLFARALGAYRSNAALSSLLLDDLFLDEWRENVDAFFARNVLGIDYLASWICQSSWDLEDESVAKIETPDGLVQFLGHIEGDRSPPGLVFCTSSADCADYTGIGSARCKQNICYDSNDNQISQYFYKVSFGVRAPSDEKLTPHKDEDGALSFNIAFKAPGITRLLYSNYIELQNGETKDDFYVQYSPREYTHVCIWFGKKPQTQVYQPFSGTGKSVMTDEVCNVLGDTEKSRVDFQNNPTQSSGPGGSTQILTI